MSVFVLVCVIRPTSNLTDSISTARVASCQKTQRITAMETGKWIASDIADSSPPIKPQHPSKKLYEQRSIKIQINQLINLQCKAYRIPLSITILFPLHYRHTMFLFNTVKLLWHNLYCIKRWLDLTIWQPTWCLSLRGNLDCGTHFNR